MNKIEYFNEGDRRLAKVNLKGSDKPAILYADDLRSLELLDISFDNWTFRNNQVTTQYRAKPVGIARLIKQARPGTCVFSIDRDGTNLRSDNLGIKFGPGKFDSVAFVTQRKDAASQIAKQSLASEATAWPTVS